jgi:hypothetical protein
MVWTLFFVPSVRQPQATAVASKGHLVLQEIQEGMETVETQETMADQAAQAGTPGKERTS